MAYLLLKMSDLESAQFLVKKAAQYNKQNDEYLKTLVNNNGIGI